MPICFRVIAVLVATGLCWASAIAQMDHDAHSGPTMNHHVINDQLATGGHIVGDGLQTLTGEGYTVVIDLRDEPPGDAGDELAAEGIEYINIPVQWRDPQPEDFEAFIKAMQANQGEKILVQCQANYRASAMTYLYQVVVDGVPEPEAREDLEAIWTPNAQWVAYMNEMARTR